MVLGVAYLFAFSGGPLQSTFAILILANIVHYFATPYQMMKDSLTKMNASWEKPMGMLKIDHIRTMLHMERIEAEWVRVHGAKPTEEDVQALYAPYEEKLLSILHNFADPKPHVLEAVAELREMGIKIGSTTGYNDKMMVIVAPAAKENGYEPDFMVTPDSTDGKGRPYPYMMFRNMEALGVTSVTEVAKVGDTVSDIKEGKTQRYSPLALLKAARNLL